MNEKRRQYSVKSKKRIVLIIAAAAAVATVCVLFATGILSFGKYDSAAKRGRLSYNSASQAGEAVATGMLSISINGHPVFETGDAEGTLGIENIPENIYLMRVKLVLADTGKTIYESGLIRPGYCIEKDRLDTSLAQGEYNATATFYAVDPSDPNKVLGKTNTAVTISVLG